MTSATKPSNSISAATASICPRCRKHQTERLHFAGVANFTAKGSGTLEQPVINAHLQIDNLVLNGDTIGSLTAADAATHGRQLN